VSEDGIVERLMRAGAATVYEAAGRTGALDARIRPMVVEQPIAGRALTVRCHPGDNLALHLAVAVAAPGDVLVVDGAGVSVGYLGDILASAALARGAVAAVIDGGTRDVAELATLGFPVWARTRAIRGASKVVPGSVRVPVVCGGVAVGPEDWVVADADGVVAVAADQIKDTLMRAERRLAAEDTMREQLGNGALTLDLLDLRASLGDGAAELIDRLRADRIARVDARSLDQ
jgi:4-hydroxy-4-methyl-2-oxoglutarate aldolase